MKKFNTDKRALILSLLVMICLILSLQFHNVYTNTHYLAWRIDKSNICGIAVFNENVKTALKEKKAEEERIAKEKAEAKKRAEEEAKKKEQQQVSSGGYVSPSELRTQGVIYDNGIKYTWYSEKVLPGGGLNIPGRHVDGNGYVCDGDGYICVASCDYPQGTVLSTPFGPAKVYDVCPTSGIVDVYVSW